MASSKVCTLALSVLCFALLIESNYAIKCFQCSSATNPKCADLSDSNIKPTDCVSNQIHDSLNTALKAVGASVDLPNEVNMNCQKLVLANQTVLRGCWFKDNSCDTYKGQHTGITFCGSCDKDGCNGATSRQLWLPALIVASSVLVVKALL